MSDLRAAVESTVRDVSRTWGEAREQLVTMALQTGAALEDLRWESVAGEMDDALVHRVTGKIGNVKCVLALAAAPVITMALTWWE